ncbi:DNA polymerase III sliding clamp [Sulfodiicoccus acidiphilus]|uniref:DNA polymerase sliding clamp n=1 Tax=Sulfodiicoccus acidiphilus TaxID=1670455 RepID=A0A348B346_9CREN|nr:DNA polymerase sliding clamp [Sulfodiicoccus acidiphilus]BBD72598.1 DNA polymerase III sliding clamp [Sulfodiicoccus acidiphilus]GGT93431.1 DNA polymerase III sliding clamp [Sulfodiicoccus acidiphilus]
MKAKVVDAPAFRRIIEGVAEFLDDVTFVVDKEGMRLRGVDGSRVALLDVELRPGFFQEYEVSEKEAIVTFKSEEVTAILRRVGKEDLLSVISNDKSVKLELEGEFFRMYELPSTTARVDKGPTINIQYPFRARLLSATFAELVEQFSDVGDTLTFRGAGRKLIGKGGGDMVDAQVELSLDNGLLLECEEGEGEGTYGTEYLSKVTKVAEASDVVNLMLGNNVPLKLSYELAGGGHFDVYIAPRTE